jgi:hypothetical protein
MTTTMTSTLTATRTHSGSVTTPVWRVGVLAGLAASVAVTAVAVTAKAIDIPMMAAPKSADVGQDIPLYGYAMGTLMSTAIGTLLAVVLAWKAKRPVPVFVVITTVLTLISFAGPITTGHATTATRVVLALTHVVAAAIVIPALARSLAPRSARR